MAEQANLGEMVIALARMAFCLLLFARCLLIAGPAHGDSELRVIRSAGTLLVGFVVSAWMANRARKGELRPAAHVLCSAFESALCFLALLTNVVSPYLGYSGITKMPDVAFVAILVFGSTLRLYWKAIVGSIAFNAISLLCLVRLDSVRNGSHISIRWADLQMISLEFTAASAASLISAWVLRRAIRRLADEGAAIARGRKYLHEVLREHHDVRTLLSAARLQLGFLRRNSHELDVAGRLEAVEGAVVGIGKIVDGIKTRTFGELIVTDEIAEIQPLAILSSAVAVAQARFPEVRIETSLPSFTPAVLLFGGDQALAHVLVNLLVNACEGDGTRHAHHVRVRLRRDPEQPGHLVFEISDDGPGFRRELLATVRRGGLTTKAEGTGVGLSLVAGIVETSSGTIAIGNVPSGGAWVAVRLRSRD
jgi:signal transduction histidine kinase